MKNILIGLAGHIDHGKTTLIQNLTGVNTDSLPEEKKRGMTIDIGFTELNLDGTSIGIIDVPGHEKFIKNMTAGITGINFVIMVIACNDGVMPQTIEHFEIVNLLGVKNGIIVLTKKDISTELQYHNTLTQCKQYFKNTFLENKIFVIDKNDLSTYGSLKSFIAREISYVFLNDSNNFRLNVDRVFSIKGFGTIVTGTIISGKVAVNDVLTLYPKNLQVRVKNIQHHNKDVNFLESGQRCALNISDVDKNDITRGDVLATTNSLYTSDKIDVLFTLLPHIKKIKTNHRIRINIGTDEIIGRIIFHDKNYICGGESALAHLILESSLTGTFHDIGIVRNFTPVYTIGNIKILKITSNMNKRYDNNYFSFLKQLCSDNSDEIVSSLLLYYNILSESEILKFINFKELDIIYKLLSNNSIIKLDKRYIHIKTYYKLLDNLKTYLKKYHIANHLESGIDKATLKTACFSLFTIKEFNEFLNYYSTLESISISNDKISLKSFKVRLNKEEKKMKEVIFSIYKNNKFNLIPFDKIILTQTDIRLFREMHKYMLENDFIVELKNNNYILKGFLKESIKIISDYFASNSTLTLSQGRQLLNCDRDSVILILEYLDKLKITKKLDNYRVLNK